MIPHSDTSRLAKADLHVHSRYSDRPSEWFLRRIGAPESFTEPAEIYQRCLAKGMDFVTISDHNSLRGVLEIADRPKVFLSAEITTYFPEDACKIHCVVSGITEAQFHDLEHVRANIYEFRDYLVGQEIIHSIAHPLFRVNGRLTVEHVEKLLLLFNRFEGINGSRHPRANDLATAVLRNLTPELIAKMADHHGIQPVGKQPWMKTLTGGSDDHSGLYLANTYTATPPAATVLDFLDHLRRGDHEAAGANGTSLKLAHSLYHTAYQFCTQRMAAGTGGGLLGALLGRLITPPEPKRFSFGDAARTLWEKMRWFRQRPGSTTETWLIQEIRQLLGTCSTAPTPREERTFDHAAILAHQLGYAFCRRFVDSLRRGEIVESIQSAAALGPLALSVAPYWAAFTAQHKDESFLQAVARQFPATQHLAQPSEKKAWVTDTFSDINGVARTIQILGTLSKAKGRQLTIVTCLSSPPALDLDLKNFTPVGTFALPEYDMQEMVFPPFLDVLRYFEEQKFAEVIISTPGPLGLAALAAGRLLGLRVRGIYHTDFPLLIRCLTHDEAIEQLTWGYMQWFFGQLDTVFVPSEYYRRHLTANGFAPDKLTVMPRGVDTALFAPERRTAGFWPARGLPAGFTFLYVGRVSADKNLRLLVDQFRRLHAQGINASLAVVGDGPLLKELRLECQDLPVAFTGFLHGEELANAYASADAFAFPSAMDTFGNVVLEAQACGLPAIVTDRGGPQEIVRVHDSGLVINIDDPAAFGDAMRRLCEDPRLHAILRTRALKNAQDASWDAVLEGLWSPVEASTDPSAYRHIQSDPTAAATLAMDIA
jgi:glycosyltransferase involved in cell wall biosynthesis/predicted metal-dependent phosphoesterase TrpH